MHTVSTVAALRTRLDTWRAAAERIAFVPTMGNLHEGHLELVRHAHSHAQRVVASIFVNPMQFGPEEDYERYPRTLKRDAQMLVEVKTDLLFAPPVEVVYPRGPAASTRVEVPEVSQGLCGAFRPGHFTGVATVVARLFNLVQPQVAVFGEKDYQQLAVIRRMVEDLGWRIDIIGVPTVRESDGLAMSSRNRYLNTQERAQAPLLYRTLCEVAEKLRAGAQSFAQLEQAAMQRLDEGGFLPQYISIRNAETLQIPKNAAEPCIVLGAAQLGKARLIDNVRV